MEPLKEAADVTGADAPSGAIGRNPCADSVAVDLGRHLTIREVGRHKEQLSAVLAASAAVTLNAASLEQLDTAGLQLIAALANELRMAGRELRWHQPPAKLRESAALLGLTDALQLPAPG